MLSRAVNALAKSFPIDWRMRRAFRLPDTDVRQCYYLGWSPKPAPAGEGWYNEARDRDGVILTCGSYHPVRIAQYALFEYGRGIVGSAESRAAFLAQARYLRAAQRDDGAYPYGIALREYGLVPGWISAMAQGEAASVLIRAHVLTTEESFARAAVHALNPLRKDIRHGGATYFQHGSVFFEEYAALAPCHVLNGHLSAAFGFWDVARVGILDRELSDIHERAVATLESWLPRYDADGWSWYHLGESPAGWRHSSTLFYHQCHIAQLKIYAVMTGRPAFAKMAARWEKALSIPAIRRRVWGHGVMRLTYGLARKLRVAKPLVWHEPTNGKRYGLGTSPPENAADASIT